MATQECVSVAVINTAERNKPQVSDNNDDISILQQRSNWEQFLMPIPWSVAVLGEIIFISAKEDFAIDKMKPEGGFKCMKYPKSFRASLLQVSNEGYEAFREAHKNMDQIRLLALNVPIDVEEVEMILAEEDPKMIEDFLPIPLESMKSTADKCLELSKAVGDKFSGVICLVNELLEACTSSKGVYEVEIKDIEKKKEIAKLQEDKARKANAKMEVKHQKLESELQQAREDYKANMDSIPVGWNAVAMGVVESLVDAVTSLSPGIVIKNLFSRGSRNEPSSKGTENNIINKDGTPENLIQMLYSFLTDDEKIDWKKLKSKNGTETLRSCKQKLREFQEAAGNGGDCPEKNATLKICETGIGICEELENLQKSEPVDEVVMADLALKIKQVMQDTTKSTSDCKAKVGNTSPHMSCSEPRNGPRGLSTASLNARFKVEQSEARLRDAQKLNEECFEEMKKNNEEIEAILENLKSCDIQKINFDQTVKMLMKGLKALSYVKEQWDKMILLFTDISDLIGSSLKPSLHKFIQYSEKSASGYSQNQFIKKKLQTYIVQVEELASMIQMIAATYVQVSTQHLMGQLSSLGKLMSLDPNRNYNEFEEQRSKFSSMCKEAGKSIEELAKANKAQYEMRLRVRLGRTNNSVTALPPPPDQKKGNKLKCPHKEEAKPQLRK